MANAPTFTTTTQDSYVLRSSVPFVLTGANRDKTDELPDGVLVRGGHAGVELVGFIRNAEATGDSDDSATAAYSLRRARFWMVTIDNVAPPRSASDQRASRYTFAWEGRAPASDDFQHQFRRALPDILAGLDHKSEEEIEWGVAELVFMLHAREMRVTRRRQLVAITLGVYLVIGLAILAVFLR